MPAHEYVNGIQFDYDNPDLGTSGKIHRVMARSGRSDLGSMLWNSKQVLNIHTAPGQERRGVATAMWSEGHRLAASSAKIPQPKHSADRTTAGDAWARSVGGRLPRQKK